ncbi:hypothetical protein CDL12_17281 [Handroanthus impetiginosus]|uniref:DNA/RNA-binding protein Alba-like domain-containing protein n=1 Tax=Handroanthus impetiginosus TaxID=429701 RepID=A0A2G9GXX9_9LAMI|nr:hypothetical protein CDL12_17281 [Handroanthus impetiginosus]
MEEIADGVNKINISESQKKNRIQVSNTKKPLFFYVNLAKRYMQQHNEVELSALGMEITTSTVEIKDDSRGRPIQKAKIEIVLGKTVNFDELMAAAQDDRENGNGED